MSGSASLSGSPKYRLPDGRQVQRKVGPAWTGRGRPPAGYFTKRSAETWLREVLDQQANWPSILILGSNSPEYGNERHIGSYQSRRL